MRHMSRLISYQPERGAAVVAVNEFWCDDCTQALRQGGGWGMVSENLPRAEWPEKCQSCGMTAHFEPAGRR